MSHLNKNDRWEGPLRFWSVNSPIFYRGSMPYLARSARTRLQEWFSGWHRGRVAISMTLFQRCRRDNSCSRVASLDSPRPLPHLPGCFRSLRSEGESNGGRDNNWSNKNEFHLFSLIINRYLPCFLTSCHVQNCKIDVWRVINYVLTLRKWKYWNCYY